MADSRASRIAAWIAGLRPRNRLVLSGLLGALAALGGVNRWRTHGRGSWAVRASIVAMVGLALALASALPGFREIYGWASDLPIGAPLRESQRFGVLWLVWAAPAAAVGAAMLAEQARSWSARLAAAPTLVLLLLVTVISAPGWWGIDGRLEPAPFPAGWAIASDIIDEEPGTVVAFPWSEYPPLTFAGGRQVFNPLPEYLGGDVISSYDPVFDAERPGQEQVDRRADLVDALSDRALAGEPIADELASLGVRWVFVTHEPGGERYRSLVVDPGLERRLALEDVDLFEVRGWLGEAVDQGGNRYELDRPVPPLIRTDAPAGSVLNVAGAPGWVQGWFDPVGVTDDGRLRLAGSGGVVWFWPAPILLGLNVAVLATALVALRLRLRDFGRILAPAATRG